MVPRRVARPSCGAPVVSIVLPVRDGAAWLARACTSVLACETPAELIVVDDGSRDESARIATALSEQDVRIRVIRRPADGLVAALRCGVSMSRGRLLARMDCDDVSLPGRIDIQVARWQELGADDRDVISCLIEPFRDHAPPASDAQDAPGEGIVRYCRWLDSMRTPSDHWRGRLIESPLCHPTVLVARAFVEQVGGYRDGPFPEDYDLWLRLIEAGARVHKVDEKLFLWQDRPGRATRVDPRYAASAFAPLKLNHLRRTWLEPRAIKGVQICGAGRDAKRWIDRLRSVGVAVLRAFDVHDGRIGQRIRGDVDVVSHVELGRYRRVPTLVAIGRAGGRDELRTELTELGMTEAEDFLFLQ